MPLDKKKNNLQILRPIFCQRLKIGGLSSFLKLALCACDFPDVLIDFDEAAGENWRFRKIARICG